MRVAVIGSGISGIGAAWLLSPEHHVDLYEADGRLGGHTNTLEIEVAGRTFPVDTGFMVFNRRTYPNLTRFFERLDISAHDADMSFSARVNDDDIEWSGTDLNTVFAQRKNLFNPKFLKMIAVHELAHIREHNHSERFWRVVASVLPDYERRQKKLKELQRRLANEDWD